VNWAGLGKTKQPGFTAALSVAIGYLPIATDFFLKGMECSKKTGAIRCFLHFGDLRSYFSDRLIAARTTAS